MKARVIFIASMLAILAGKIQSLGIGDGGSI